MSNQEKILMNSDCLELLRTLQDNFIDSVVTDPPAGISFMGKDWDSNKGGSKQWIAWMEEVMVEVLRVLKPGGHALVWAIPRTSHWTATALENAGFEIRDVIIHVFGSGFPKSLNISKALEKQETNEAKQWDGWGTALKPASEHWILVRKPLSEKTVANNVLKWDTGGINIDGSRVGGKPRSTHSWGNKKGRTNGYDGGWGRDFESNSPQCRFPANFVLSHHPECECVGVKEVKAIKVGEGAAPLNYKLSQNKTGQKYFNYADENGKETVEDWKCHPDCPVKLLDDQSGVLDSGASRFFYCAKASKKDKGGDANNHPTVKSTKLMSYLIKLITPTNGLVLDPFMGSGSTGVAALKEGFSFFGIEKEEEYYNIACKRILDQENS